MAGGDAVQGQQVITIVLNVPYATTEQEVKEAAEEALEEARTDWYNGGIFENVEVRRIEDARTVYNA